jgi:predicted ferric reductase
MTIDHSSNLPDEQSSMNFKTLLLLLFGISAGITLAIIILPFWAPNMAASMLGQDPKVFWFLSRATAFVAMGLLWISMALGLAITNKLAHLWPGGPTAFAIHEYTSILGLALVLFHGLLLLGDHYIHLNLAQILLPFGSITFKPFWVGLGQSSLYLWALVAGSFYVRKAIGKKTWRLLHFATFIAYLAALVHGLMVGSDSSANWAITFYWFTGGSLLFLFIYRILVSLFPSPKLNFTPGDKPITSGITQQPEPVFDTTEDS